MNTLTPKEVVVQWFERVWNAKDKSAIPLLMSEDAIAHLAGDLQAKGREEFSHFQDTLLSAFPDLTVQILRVVGDETQACLHWQARASHKGEFAGIAQTDRPVHFTGMSFVTVRDGKITEGWDSWDYGSFVTTLRNKIS